jgi:DNA-binding transcriptional regulator YdaS (Cro superfamily)
MNLAEYLQQPGVRARELADAVDVDPAQVRQWQMRAVDRTNKCARQPSAANAFAIESATGGKVRRWDLRPEDWNVIWPDLVGAPGAPPEPMAPRRKRGSRDGASVA